jgi:hypothetical protein
MMATKPTALMPFRTTSTRTDSAEMTSIEDVERLFLMGNFCEALLRANRQLLESLHEQLTVQLSASDGGGGCGGASAADDISAGDDNQTLKCGLPRWTQLQTRVRLNFDTSERERRFRVAWIGSAEASLSPCIARDRFGAVALQSWYELSSQRMTAAAAAAEDADDDADMGYRFLQPFVELYTEAPMSLELFVIWVQFCRCRHVGDHTDAAIEWTGEVLHHIRRCENRVDPNMIDQDSVRELVLLLLTDLLPSHSNAEATEDLLRRLTVDDFSAVVDSTKRPVHRNLPSSDRKNVIQQCLCFCNTDEGNWPAWLQDTLEQARISHQQMLQEIYRKKESAENLMTEPITVPLSKTQGTLLARRKSLSWIELKRNLLPWLQLQLSRSKSILIRDQKGAGQNTMIDRYNKQHVQAMLFVFCVVFYGWRYHHRHRQRLSHAVQKALAFTLWKPLREILEAFGLLKVEE